MALQRGRDPVALNKRHGCGRMIYKDKGCNHMWACHLPHIDCSAMRSLSTKWP